MRLMPTTAILAAAILVSSCQSFGFLPSYDAALYKHASGVGEEIDKIAASVNTVHGGAASFDKVESYYVAAFAHLTEANRIVDGQRTYHAGRVAAEPARLIDDALDRCRQALEAVMNRHRQAPISAATWSTLALDETCDVPALMVGRLNRGDAR